MTPLVRTHLRVLLVYGAAAAALTACGSSTELDYATLEQQITDKLTNAYEPMGVTVDSVECPEQSPSHGPGETFDCDIMVEGLTMTAAATVLDQEDYNVKWSLKEMLFDLPELSPSLSKSVSDQVGFPVTADCGNGFTVVEIDGGWLECAATDPEGVERTVRVKPDPEGQNYTWELLE